MSIIGVLANSGINDDTHDDLASSGISVPSDVTDQNNPSIILTADPSMLSDMTQTEEAAEIIEDFADYNIIIKPADEKNEAAYRLGDVANLIFAQEAISNAQIESYLARLEPIEQALLVANEKEKICTVSGFIKGFVDELPLNSFTNAETKVNLSRSKELFAKKIEEITLGVQSDVMAFFSEKADKLISDSLPGIEALLIKTIEQQTYFRDLCMKYKKNADCSNNYLVFATRIESDSEGNKTKSELMDLRKMALSTWSNGETIISFGIDPALMDTIKNDLASKLVRAVIKKTPNNFTPSIYRAVSDTGVSLADDDVNSDASFYRGIYISYNDLLSLFISDVFLSFLETQLIYVQRAGAYFLEVKTCIKENKPIYKEGHEVSFRDVAKDLSEFSNNIESLFSVISKITNLAALCAVLFKSIDSYLTA